MSLEERSRERRKRMVVHLARDFDDAERWDLESWQSHTPAARLAAALSILRDMENVKRPRSKDR